MAYGEGSLTNEGTLTWDDYVAQENPTGVRGTSTHTTTDPAYAPGQPARLAAEARGIQVNYTPPATSASELDQWYQDNLTSAQLGEEPNTRFYEINPDGTGGELTITYIDGATETFATDRNGNVTDEEPIRSTAATRNVSDRPTITDPMGVDYIVHNADGSITTWFRDGTSSTRWPDAVDPGVEHAGLIAEITEAFPWAVELGFLDLIKTLVVDGASAEQIIAEVRQSLQYQQRFPGMVGPDGIRRYRTEAEYLTSVEEYRGVLKDFGEYDRATDTPMNYVAFMDSGIDPNELKDRLTTFRSIQAGSQQLKDAFYVYAGMDVTDEDLYQVVVSPQFREELTNEYDLTVANTTLDYDQFIERARQTSTAAVVKTLETLAARNATTGAMVSRIMTMDPVYGRTLIASLFTGGDTASGARTLTLSELTEAFAAAVMGSAATEAGWEIPSKARIEEFRAAGIEASQLHGIYDTMTLKENAYAGMINRAGRGTKLMGDVDKPVFQEMFEQGLLGRNRELGYAQAAESARGARGGGFAATQEGRRFAQRGRSTRS